MRGDAHRCGILHSRLACWKGVVVGARSPTHTSAAYPPRLSHAEVFAHDVVRQLVDRAAGHAAALLEDAELAGHAPRERQLLLDEQHRDAGFAIQPAG